MKHSHIKATISPVFSAYQENESIIKRFLRRFTSNSHDIEDICQETILRALEAEKTRCIHEPRAFLFGVTRNIIRKKLDKDSRSIIDFIGDMTPREYVTEDPTIEDCVDSRKRLFDFIDAVTALPQQCQKVFVLKKVYGYSHKEIAKEIGISISTVEKHVAMGLKRCSDYMERFSGSESSSDSNPCLAGKRKSLDIQR